jgi:hypothetical protein
MESVVKEMGMLAVSGWAFVEWLVFSVIVFVSGYLFTFS